VRLCWLVRLTSNFWPLHRLLTSVQGPTSCSVAVARPLTSLCSRSASLVLVLHAGPNLFQDIPVSIKIVFLFAPQFAQPAYSVTIRPSFPLGAVVLAPVSYKLVRTYISTIYFYFIFKSKMYITTINIYYIYKCLIIAGNCRARLLSVYLQFFRPRLSWTRWLQNCCQWEHTCCFEHRAFKNLCD
jgi:hypothetical protein